MKTHEQCKSAGLKSLVEVSRLTKVQTQTLRNWSKDKVELFKIIILGCVRAKKNKDIEEFYEGHQEFLDSKK